MSCNCNMNSNNNDTNFENYAELPDDTMNVDFYNNSNNECSCGFDDDNAFPYNAMYGHCYVPNQKMKKTFTPEIALKKGTIFPELVSPYCPNQSISVIEYLKSRNEIGEGCNK